MADKIVILEDENGNNIYPITRGLAADSVDTNAIQDGAVTSSKIDWTTFNDSSEHRVGTWIDGKPLYRKAFNMGSFTSGVAATFLHNIANVEMIYVESMFLWKTSSKITRQVNIFDSTSTNYVQAGQTNITYLISSGQDPQDSVAIAIVNYTKTTD